MMRTGAGDPKDVRRVARPPGETNEDHGAYRRYFYDNVAGAFRAWSTGTLFDVNPALVRLLGVDSRTELVGRRLDRFFDGGSSWRTILENARAGGSTEPEEVALRRRDGSVLVALVGASLTGERILHQPVLCGTVVDITSRKRIEVMLRRKAYRDALTGLVNRYFLEEHAERCLATARRGGHALGFVYVDLTGFKEINDTYGHAAGDEALAEVAKRLREGSRSGDVVARVGGDEFVVLLPEVDGFRSAVDVVRRLARGLGRPVETEGASFEVGADFGLAVFPVHGQSFEELVEAADEAMYRAKSGSSTLELARPAVR